MKENRKVKSLITFKDWTAKEAEYKIQATEIKQVLNLGNSNWKLHGIRSKSIRINQAVAKKKGTCKVCGANHAVCKCEVFRSRSIQERWGTAKKLGLSYRCLGGDHLGGECPRSSVCNTDGCRDRHNRLLHANPPSRPPGKPASRNSVSGNPASGCPATRSSASVDPASVNKNNPRKTGSLLK